MLPSKAVLSRLLQALYDAAADASLWPAFLRDVSVATRGQKAALVMHDADNREHGLALDWGIGPEMAQLYSQYYGSRDIWMQKAIQHAGGRSLHSGWVATSEEVCAPEDLYRSEFYNDHIGPIGIAHAMWATVENSRSQSFTLGTYRSRARGAFRPADLDLLRFLAPHMKRVMHLQSYFTELKARQEGWEAASDMLPGGLLLLRASGRIAAMNRRAGEMIAAANGLLVREGRLQAERPGESAQLEDLVAKAEAASSGKGLSPAGAMLISRRAKRPLHLLIAPIRRANVAGVAPIRAVVFVTDPEGHTRSTNEILRALFGLSAAECRVALLLGDGHAPAVIAEMLGVSGNTLKTQLASIYRKTNTPGQTQLVRLLLQLAFSPFEGDREH